MTNNRQCAECGAALSLAAPEGLCPACLLERGLETQTAAGESTANIAPPTPQELAPYFPALEILELLGRGGMGVVYKARHRQLDRIVALKILPGTGRDPAFAERFAREARALARLSHPHIVGVHDSGESDGLFYFVMEYVDGVNLRRLLDSRQMAPEEALAIVPQICEALQYAHDQGIVHRDIKPENILIDKAGQVKIADFGIAKIVGTAPADITLTGEGERMGTPAYMAPEQIEHPADVDHRADIYSLGVVFYQMLTGELPLGRFAPPSKKVVIDVRLDEVVLRALEKEPDLRYQQAVEVKTEVDTIAMEMGSARTSSAVSGASVGNLLSGIRRPGTSAPKTSRKLWRYGFAAAGIFIGLGIWFIMAQHQGNASQLVQEGWQSLQEGRLSEAATKFELAVKLSPNDADAWNGLGWASFNAGDEQEAGEAFHKVLSLEPNHPAALNGLGQLDLAQQNYKQAEHYLLKAAPQAPAAWYGLARLYLLEGKFEEAEEWAQKLVDSGQGDATAAKMLEAAKEERLGDGLRFVIEPRPAADRQQKAVPAVQSLQEAAVKKVVKSDVDAPMQKRALAFVELLANGNFAEATADFDGAMRAAMPASKLADLWRDLGTAGGKFLGANATTRVEKVADYIAVFVPCRWERNRVDLKVVFDSAGRISGLWIWPPSPEETK